MQSTLAVSVSGIESLWYWSSNLQKHEKKENLLIILGIYTLIYVKDDKT